jgi:hypothetical protein
MQATTEGVSKRASASGGGGERHSPHMTPPMVFPVLGRVCVCVCARARASVRVCTRVQANCGHTCTFAREETNLNEGVGA